jgi:signal transduction histidine kinase
LNVVNNAIEACERRPGARVVASTRLDRERRMLMVNVQDNGEGIPAEDLSRVFAAFESRKGARGTGLGLPVSQKILREHGGRITVTSQMNEGSRFVLELPAISPESSTRGDTLAGELEPSHEP